MRADALGFFWRDEPVEKVAKEVIKRIPPEPVWLRPDYLPGLEEALRFPVPVMTESDLLAALRRRDRFAFDIECYVNYFLAAFISVQTGQVTYVESAPGYPLDINRLWWILSNFTTVGFNSLQYDLPIVSLALAEKTCQQLKEATNHIIFDNWRGTDVLRQYRTKSITKLIDHIDLIEVAPLHGGLKVYGGRLHAQRMQDLPFFHAATLSPEQMAIVRWYCVNDLTQTAVLGDALKEQLILRESLTKEYGVDVRSKSDAQIAEAVIAQELERRTRVRPQKPTIEVGTRYRYKVPAFIQYHTELMQWALSVVANADFIVGETGAVEEPVELSNLQLKIADNTYTMGIGGLHSTEQIVTHVADKEYSIYDRDVTSYYPQIILNLGLFPQHLGRVFLDVYQTIVNKRLRAKKDKLALIAESLKITVNGAFGKLGSKFSILYAPDLLTQVTLTGQLALLMMIERFELAGIHVISANTDGITFKVHKTQQDLMRAIIKQWEIDTGFETEETQYRAYYGRDVNNYIAIGSNGKIKSKGAYSNPWAHMDDSKNSVMRMHKNPVTTVVLDAVEQLLLKGTPIENTIRPCTDITRFVVLRTVTGGAVKDGEYLGKTIRWYYSTERKEGENIIVVAKTGNKVPRSEGAKPLMVLPATLPVDIDYNWYEEEARRVLTEIGYLRPETAAA